MVNMNVAYRGPDGMSKQLLSEIQSRFGARTQNKGFVTGYMNDARAGQKGGHFADKFGITHAVDIGVDIESDGSGLLPKDALWLAEHLRQLGASGKHPFSKQGYLIHDLSNTTTPVPRIAGAFSKWQWVPYTGASPHSDHIHLSTAGDQQWGEAPVLDPSIYNSTQSWGVSTAAPTPNTGTGWAMRPAPEMYPQTQGYREDKTQYNVGNVHGAIDIGAPIGTPLVAPEDGTVVFDGWSWDLPGGPNDYHLRWYLIKPPVGRVKEGAGIVTVFQNMVGSTWYLAHANESFFKKGDRIRKGQHIQNSGNTGFSTGPHTHIGLLPKNPNWQNGAFGHIDPAPYIREKYAPISAVSWQGGSTGGAGAVLPEKDWFDMATKAELQEVVRAALIKELTYSRKKKEAEGSVSIQDEILYLAHNFANVRKDIAAVKAAVSPATLRPLFAQVLTEALPQDTTAVDTAELADKLAEALLAHVVYEATKADNPEGV